MGKSARIAEKKIEGGPSEPDLYDFSADSVRLRERQAPDDPAETRQETRVERSGAGKWGLFALVTLLVIQILSNELPPKYLGFEQLVFPFTEGLSVCGKECTGPVGSQKLPGRERSLVWDPSISNAEIRRAVTAPFTLHAAQFEIALAGFFPKGLVSSPRIRLLTAGSGSAGDREELASYAIPRGDKPLAEDRWQVYRFVVPAEARDVPLVMEITAKPGSIDRVWVGLRARLDRYGRASVGTELRQSRFGSALFVGLAVCAGAMLAMFLLSGRLGSLSEGAFFTVLLLFGAAAHFRPEVFFYFDEFHVFERMRDHGIEAALIKHNEHFLPLFFAAYFLESRIFQGQPYLFLAVSLILHATVGLLGARFLERIAEGRPAARTAARFLALIFIVHGVYGEVLRWIFEQSVLLSSLAMLLAASFGYDVIRRRGSGGNRSGASMPAAVASIVCALAAPLCFGNGFSVFFVLLGVAAFVLLVPQFSPNRAPGESRRGELFRAGGILVGVSTALACAAMLYSVNRSDPANAPAAAGGSLAGSRPEIDRVIEYAFSGSECGTVLRGFGLLPIVELDAAAVGMKFLGLRFERPEVVFAWMGLAVSIGVLIGILRPPGDRLWGAACWALGQWIAITSFVLPALGRWSFGNAQSLASRYHYFTLLGVGLMIFPLVLRFVGRSELRMIARSRRAGAGERRWKEAAVFSLLTVFLAAQLYSGHEYSYFVERGAAHRTYAAQLRDWNIRLRALSPDSRLPYEATGTPLENLHPLHVESITPGRHPDQIYDVLHWLNPDRYPRR